MSAVPLLGMRTRIKIHLAVEGEVTLRFVVSTVELVRDVNYMLVDQDREFELDRNLSRQHANKWPLTASHISAFSRLCRNFNRDSC
jgi:hypothetical protein